MAKSLDDRISAAMGADARIATVADLIEEVGTVITQTEAEHGRLDALSKSATAAEAEADEAADCAAKLARKIIRLNAKRDQLTARHEELVDSERQKRLRAEYDQAKARRDELAAEITEVWPQLTGDIVALLRKLQASDRECAAVNRYRVGDRLISAEAVARECPPTFSSALGPMLRFYSIRIPTLRGKGLEQMAWPVDDPMRVIAVPIP